MSDDGKHENCAYGYEAGKVVFPGGENRAIGVAEAVINPQIDLMDPSKWFMSAADDALYYDPKDAVNVDFAKLPLPELVKLRDKLNELIYDRERQ